MLTGTTNRLPIVALDTLAHVAAAGVVLASVALIGLGLGVILRSSATTIAALPALLYLPLVALGLPAPWNHRVVQFSLLGGAYQLVALHPSHQLLPPVTAILIVLAWPAIVLAIAAIVVTRRDA